MSQLLPLLVEAPAYAPDPFQPAWWLPHAHLQTIAGRLLRPRPRIELRRERLELPDGDFVDLDFTPEPAAQAPVVLLLHGLEGSTRRKYALVTFAELAAHGLRGVGLNFRSCSGEPNRLARSYHSGETGDLRYVLEQLAARFPQVPCGAIGFSLGGNALLKFLGESGDAARSLLQAAVAVSVPFDLAAGAHRLEQGFSRFYTWLFVRSLRRKMEVKAGLIASVCDLERVRRARTFREFDDAATAPLHGFATAQEYYEQSSCGRYLEAIRVPALLLHAEDDPFLPAAAIPRAAIARNRYLSAAITPCGGHAGFLGGGRPWQPTCWAEQQAARFLALQLGGR